MHGLGHQHRIHAGVGQAAGVGGGVPVLHPVMGGGAGQLAGAGIGADHRFKVLGQGQGGLAVAAATVPGQLALAAVAGEGLKKGLRIGGPEVGVVRGDGAEQLGNGIARAHGVRAQGSGPLIEGLAQGLAELARRRRHIRLLAVGRRHHRHQGAAHDGPIGPPVAHLDR